MYLDALPWLIKARQHRVPCTRGLNSFQSLRKMGPKQNAREGFQSQELECLSIPEEEAAFQGVGLADQGPRCRVASPMLLDRKITIQTRPTGMAAGHHNPKGRNKASSEVEMNSAPRPSRLAAATQWWIGQGSTDCSHSRARADQFGWNGSGTEWLPCV